MLFGDLDPANNFAMGGLSMHFAKVLITLLLDVMVKKTQILIEHIKNHHLGLCLTSNIRGNTAVIRVYDNFATVNSQILQLTISNLLDLEDQLFHLYM